MIGDMYLAVQELLRSQGGYTLVENGKKFTIHCRFRLPWVR